MFARRLFSLAAGCALFASSGALAQQVVWDSPVNPDLPAFVDQRFGDFLDFSTYLVHHIRFERKIDIYAITTYYTNQNNLWPQGPVNGAYSIFGQEGNLPGPNDDPSAHQAAGNMVLGANGLEFTIDLGGEVVLQAGNYWIGVTPSLDSGTDRQEFHQGSDFFLKNSAGRNPGGGFGVGTDWFEAGPVFGGVDWGGAITITGKNVPAPGTLALLGMGLVGTRRRRRK